MSVSSIPLTYFLMIRSYLSFIHTFLLPLNKQIRLIQTAFLFISFLLLLILIYFFQSIILLITVLVHLFGFFASKIFYLHYRRFLWLRSLMCCLDFLLSYYFIHFYHKFYRMCSWECRKIIWFPLWSCSIRW